MEDKRKQEAKKLAMFKQVVDGHLKMHKEGMYSAKMCVMAIKSSLHNLETALEESDED